MLSSPLKPEMWFSFSILGGKYEVKGCDFSVVIMAALNFCGFFFFLSEYSNFHFVPQLLTVYCKNAINQSHNLSVSLQVCISGHLKTGELVKKSTKISLAANTKPKASKIKIKEGKNQILFQSSCSI